jgi:hypothetical protein
MPRRSAQMLLDLLKSKPVVEFKDILRALDGASSATAFRYLRQIPYRTSYNYNGRYYALHKASHYDRLGLFRHGDIYFSRDGTLKATVCRLIRESEVGFTQRELQELLRVRVQIFLQALVEGGKVGRKLLAGIFHYLHIEPEIQEAQLQRRMKRIAAAKESKVEIDDNVVIRVLLVVIRHPGSASEQVVRYLRGYTPPIMLGQVDAVFTRYAIGQKGGPTIF